MSSFNKKIIHSDAKKLSSWFKENSRPMPWRESRDPYKIWISEIMLQQTTVKAVIPYFEKFIKKFPNVKKLGKAQIEDIYTLWAGLGYYSRARSLHKAAIELSKLKKFPESFSELIKLPGFGDYTSRAVSSQAFAEKVGVVDGNVIRVLSRRFGLALEWWKTAEKKQLQNLADEFVQKEDPSTINQALMELGSTICKPKKPTCLLCPIKKSCVALKENKIDNFPLKKKRKESEIWVWQVDLYENKNQIAFTKNEYAPFLKGQWILPGKVSKRQKVPTQYDFQHMITHHKIYVRITRKRSKFSKNKNEPIEWISRKQLKQKVPFTLIQKAIDIGLGDRK